MQVHTLGIIFAPVQAVRSILASLLILAMMAFGVSPELFHDHEDEHAHGCEEAHQPDSIDACHLAVAHGQGIAQCDDHSHVTSQHFHCELCGLSPAITVYDFTAPSEVVITLASSQLLGSQAAVWLPSIQYSHILLRGPPVVT